MAEEGDIEAAGILASMPAEPLLSVHSVFYWRAYLDLGRDRPVAMDGMAQIPYSAICRYADEYDIHGIEREEFKNIITAVDNFEVNQTNEKRRCEQAKASSKR